MMVQEMIMEHKEDLNIRDWEYKVLAEVTLLEEEALDGLLANRLMDRI